MASLTIRNLDNEVKQKLRVRAAEHGRSMEEEARRILEQAVDGGKVEKLKAWSELQNRMAKLTPSGATSIVDELIAERRAEAARENE